MKTKMDIEGKASKPTETCQSNWTLQYIASISASLATFSSGIVFGWPSQITDKLLDDKFDFPVTTDDLGWVCSASSVGAALLTIFIGSLCDRIGRKLTMLLLILVSELGWSLIIFSTNVWMLIVGRFFTGMACGSYCVTVSMYIGEVAQKEVRGVLGGLTQFMVSCGILFANITGAFVSIRSLSVACASVPIVFGLVFLYMPESPVYWLVKGRAEDSKASLRRLLGKYHVEEEFEQMKKQFKCDSKPLSTVDVLKKKSTKMACVIGIGLALLKVFSGIDSVTSYLSHIFSETSAKLGPRNASIIFSTFQVISVVPQTLLIDRLGRKVLLVSSQIVMGLGLGATALCLLLDCDSTILEYLPIVALCLFTVGFSTGIGPIGWIVTAEIFDEKIKGRAMSLCTFLVWFLAFVSVKMFGVLEDSFSISVPLFFYCVVSLAGAVFVLVCLPDTKNKSFEEIEKILSK